MDEQSAEPSPKEKSAELRRRLWELLDDYSLSPTEFRRRLDELLDDEGGRTNGEKKELERS